MVAMG
jgi:hypothetical protein